MGTAGRVHGQRRGRPGARARCAPGVVAALVEELGGLQQLVVPARQRRVVQLLHAAHVRAQQREDGVGVDLQDRPQPALPVGAKGEG